MAHAVNLWFREMAYQLCDGFSVNTGWFTASVHIKGTFNSPQEQFNPEKHHVLFEFHQGAALRNELSTVAVDIMGVADSGALITQVVDIKTGSINDLLTPGRNLKISGQKIRVTGDKPEVGILFRSTEDPELTVAVPAEDIGINNPSELFIIIPPLAVGAYRLEITTQYSISTHLLKMPRTAIFDKVLEVK
jgi:hypothetical protein